MTTDPVPPETLHGWTIYLQACEEARRRGDRRAGTEHVLLALFQDPATEALLGVSLQQARQALDSLDTEALATLGLGPDADAPDLPMHPVPKKPGLRDLMKNGRFPMTPAAKKALEDAARPNRNRIQVTAGQVLARLFALQPPDPAAALLAALGVDTAEVGRQLDLPGAVQGPARG
jgi:ATP-dependent Clp protease ATP-binding subunit ClpA